MNNSFDKLAWVYNPLAKLFGNPEKYYRKIRNISNIKKSDAVLDVGGGTGLVAKYFLADASRIVVLDPSEKMLGKIESDKIEKVVGIAQKIKFQNNAFDLVYCVDSFHHFTNGYDKRDYVKTTDLCIREMLRVLKKDGTLIIIEFDIGKFRGRIVEFFENKIMRCGSNFYSPVELMKLFRKYMVSTRILYLDDRCYIAKITKNDMRRSNG